MNISNPELKAVIFNILHFTDDVDNNGAQTIRTSFKKEHSIGVIRLKKAIKNEVTLLVNRSGKKKEDLSISDVDLVKIDDVKHSDKANIVGEKYGDGVLELDDKMLGALKYYFKERDHLPEVSEDVLLKLEEIVK